MIRLRRNGLKTEEAPIILAELAESFALNRQIQQADGIAAVGSVFGQVLAVAGRDEEALAVLDLAAAAFTRLQRPDEVAQIRAFQETIRARGG